MRKERVEEPAEGVGSHTPVTGGRGIKSDVGYLGIFSVGPDPVLGSPSLHSILISVRTSAITAMRNHLFVFLVVLIFSVSLNRKCNVLSVGVLGIYFFLFFSPGRSPALDPRFRAKGGLL